MTCIVCKKAPARAGQKSCLDCHAGYMRDWRKTSVRKRDLRAYMRGVEAFRVTLKEVFRAIGSAELSGYTAVNIVDNCAAKVPRETFT